MGFQLGFWDYATFAALIIIGAANGGLFSSSWDFRARSQSPASTRKPKQ